MIIQKPRKLFIQKLEVKKLVMLIELMEGDVSYVNRLLKRGIIRIWTESATGRAVMDGIMLQSNCFGVREGDISELMLMEIDPSVSKSKQQSLEKRFRSSTEVKCFEFTNLLQQIA